MDEYLTTKEIASLLKINVLTVRRWIEKRQLIAYRFNKEYRINKADFELFLKERKVK
jgi:excisionase family DNA binding protein